MLDSLIAEGRTSCVYADGPGRAVKVLNPGVPAHWAVTEAVFTQHVRRLGVRAPEVFDVVERDGRAALLVERVDGPSMWVAMRDSQNGFDALVEEFCAIQRRILKAGIPDGLPNAIDRTRWKIDEVEPMTPDERGAAAAIVDTLPAGAATLHGDFHPGNVLLSDDGPVVIDWFDASVGHPIFDVIRTSLLIRPLHVSSGTHLPGADHGLLERLHRAYADSMVDVVHAHVDRLGRWEAAAAASRLSECSDPDPADLRRVWDRRGGPLADHFARQSA